ncbi:hypothetical protein EG329_004515 [Mollisiaceae sp. DMI_Dod_QoI]|nr:hypothetical protein EG329_004515 [Helotiales sp. DMI_Dod_QoI]
MSSSYGISDFIAVYQLATKIRGEFVDAPSEFKETSNLVKSLLVVLQDLEAILKGREITGQEQTELNAITVRCHDTLRKLDTMEAHHGLNSSGGSIGKIVKGVWRRRKWKPENILELQGRITSIITLSTVLFDSLTRDSAAKLIGGVCSRCRCMTETHCGLQALTGELGYTHYTKVEIEDSKAAGCECCDLLYNLWGHLNWRGPLHLSAVCDQWTRTYTQSPLRRSPGQPLLQHGDGFSGIFRSGGPLWKHLEIYADSGAFTYDPAATYVSNRPIAKEFGSQACIEASKHSLQECISRAGGHHDCIWLGAMQLPARVIDVGSTDITPKLFEARLGHLAEYVALSYCWGGPQENVLTRATIHDMKMEIPVATLPPTLQDAIAITRKLGFQYLWVDSLCIVQDDPQDTATQIAEMGTIYKYATVTIAAAQAKGAKDGFLKAKKHPPFCKLPLRLPDGSLGTISVMLKADPTYDEPLHNRGWALQEFLLSPRLLIYGELEVHFQCQSERQSVTKSSIRYRHDYPCRRLPNEVFNKQTTNEERHGMARLWEQIVCHYTRSRSMTYDADWLPGIAGIASELQKAWSDDYFAGLWGKSISIWLAWKRDHPTDVRPRPTYRAPTWSWVSIDGAINFHYSVESLGLMTEHAQLVHCFTEPTQKEAPMGQLKGGIITVRAVVLGFLELQTRFISGGIVDSHNFSPDCSGTEKTIEENLHAFFLILGFGSYSNVVGIAIEHMEDGNYQRIGSLELRGKGLLTQLQNTPRQIDNCSRGRETNAAFHGANEVLRVYLAQEVIRRELIVAGEAYAAADNTNTAARIMFENSHVRFAIATLPYEELEAEGTRHDEEMDRRSD